MVEELSYAMKSTWKKILKKLVQENDLWLILTACQSVRVILCLLVRESCSYLHFFSSCFLRGFFRHMVLSNTKNFKQIYLTHSLFYKLFWTNPGSNTRQNNSCTTTYLPSKKKKKKKKKIHWSMMNKTCGTLLEKQKQTPK